VAAATGVGRGRAFRVAVSPAAELCAGTGAAWPTAQGAVRHNATGQQ
jgi:hypothetical protein